jgi:acyl-CoA thioesterase
VVCHDGPVGQWHDDTQHVVVGAGRFRTVPSAYWNIGGNANVGYALSSLLRSAADLAGHPDPLTVTAHFLRPLQPDGTPAEITVECIKPGRSTSVVRADMTHLDRHRLTVLAAFGDLATPASAAPGALDVAPPSIPPPDDCLDRSGLEQGVTLPILERLDVFIHPDRAGHATSEEAVVEGWIRFADGTPPSTLTLPLFADAFPPSLFPKYGRVGWVPTVELTVHVRRRPAPGWIQARFECDDLHEGRMIETGTLWDSTGAVVARSRQLGLLLTEG